MLSPSGEQATRPLPAYPAHSFLSVPYSRARTSISVSGNRPWLRIRHVSAAPWYRSSTAGASLFRFPAIKSDYHRPPTHVYGYDPGFADYSSRCALKFPLKIHPVQAVAGTRPALFVRNHKQAPYHWRRLSESANPHVIPFPVFSVTKHPSVLRTEPKTSILVRRTAKHGFQARNAGIKRFKRQRM